MAAPSSSSILSDALAAFSQAATFALATAEDAARAEVAQANADARESRRERDDAVKAIHQAQLEEREWKQEYIRCKAALDKAEVSIRHHLESLVQARHEAQGWKDQFVKLEESSRREIQDWKDQFLRVDTERSRLSSRIDELVAEQLLRASAFQASFLSRPQTSDVYESNISPLARGASTSQLLPPAAFKSANLESPTAHAKQSPMFEKKVQHQPRSRPSKPVALQPNSEKQPPRRAAADTPLPQSSPFRDHAMDDDNPRGRKRKAIVEIARPSKSQARSASRTQDEEEQTHRRSQVIRRVHAVINIPIKQEEDDNEDAFDGSPSGSQSESESASGSAPAQNESARRRKVRHKTRQDDTYAGDEKDREDDLLEVEGAVQSLVESDDDDELMMGAEDNRKELYGGRRVVVTAEVETPSKHARTAPNKRVSASKKRRIAGS